MVAILPAGDTVRERLMLNAGEDSGGMDCLAAQSGEEVLGAVAFVVTGECVCLCAIDALDTCIADGLIRAALNKARSKGAVTACCALAPWFAQLKALGFANKAGQEQKSELYADINHVLKGTCCSDQSGQSE